MLNCAARDPPCAADFTAGIEPLVGGRCAVAVASHFHAIGDPADPGRVELQELREFAALGVIATARDETLDFRGLLQFQNALAVTLHFRTATIQKLKQYRKFIIHIYRLG